MSDIVALCARHGGGATDSCKFCEIEQRSKGRMFITVPKRDEDELEHIIEALREQVNRLDNVITKFLSRVGF